jgi:hypothetical protein
LPLQKQSAICRQRIIAEFLFPAFGRIQWNHRKTSGSEFIGKIEVIDSDFSPAKFRAQIIYFGAWFR